MITKIYTCDLCKKEFKTPTMIYEFSYRMKDENKKLWGRDIHICTFCHDEFIGRLKGIGTDKVYTADILN